MKKPEGTNLVKKSLSSKFILPVIAILAGVVGYVGVQAFSAKNRYVSSSSCKGICVSIERDGMKPSELAVKTGEFVQFNTADNQKHNLSLGNGLNPEKASNHGSEKNASYDGALAHEHDAGFESGEFGPGEAYRVQFKRPGTYVMHDHGHPTNRILIIVYNPSK